MTPEFLVASLAAQRDQILARARGVNTEGLTLEALKSLSVPHATVDEMNAFSAAVFEHHKAIEAAHRGEHLIRAIIASLNAHAFTGELTTRWRESNVDSLRAEGIGRDVALRTTSVTISGTARITAAVTVVSRLPDGAYAELTREQHVVLEAAQRRNNGPNSSRWFTAEELAKNFDGPLRGHRHAIEVQLAVLAARGLVIAVSREEPAPMTGEIVFGNAYRLPLDEFQPRGDDPREPVQGERARLRELERLAELLRKEPS
jgi:hypothetical protein